MELEFSIYSGTSFPSPPPGELIIAGNFMGSQAKESWAYRIRMFSICIIGGNLSPVEFFS